jgi:dienelactone hydrolase
LVSSKEFMKIILTLPTALLLIFLCGAAAASEQIMVPVDYRGREIELSGWFDKPDGPGPFPVVIGLHSCSGYYANMDSGSLPGWISFLQQQGYATFKFDSFTARGYSEVCATNAVTAAERAGDVLKAAYLLAGRPDVLPDDIAAIGFSHGGGTAVYVARDYPELRPLRTQLAARGGKLAASVGVYPGCGTDPYHNPVVVPLLALAGGSDDWTPAARCVSLKDANPGAPITVKVYPGAYHAFDLDGRAHYKLGHWLAYDAAATANAHARVQAFLYRYLH